MVSSSGRPESNSNEYKTWIGTLQKLSSDLETRVIETYLNYYNAVTQKKKRTKSSQKRSVGAIVCLIYDAQKIRNEQAT